MDEPAADEEIEMTETVVLQTQDLTKRYGELTAVDRLSLEVFEGEVLGILGPNGAGKTTSINLMCGLLTPDSGKVFIHGTSIAAGDSDLKARVGVCPQDIVLWERLTCLEQLEFMGQMYGIETRLARSRGEQLLAELDLTEKRGVQARRLSGGLQRRLNLAMALIHDPEILVLDEPEAGLDPQSRVKVRSYIQSLARVKTVILTTHNMDEADRVADRVAIIDQGRLLELDSPQALKARVGEGDVVEIGLAQVPPQSSCEAATRALSSLAAQVRVDPELRQVTVRALNAIRLLPNLLETLEKQGLIPGEVRVRENTLEDVFIQLTGRRLRE